MTPQALVSLLLAVYLAGAAVALVATDAKPAARLGLALFWPLGPLAFLLTVKLLLAASLVAFPRVAGAVLAAAILLFLLAR